MNTKFNIETAKKLLSVYAENVNFYIRENKMLKNQLKDIQISLQINKELLFKELNMKLKDTDIILYIKKEKKIELMDDDNNNMKGPIITKVYKKH